MSKNREKKEKIVAELLEKVKKTKALVFTNYEGMTHQQIEELRKVLRPVEAEYVVAKNTLLKLSLDQSQNSNLSPRKRSEAGKSQNLESNLKGQTGTLFAYNDAILAIKELVKKFKQLNLNLNKKGPTIKFGIFEGKNLEESEILRLSTLPSYEVLIAQFVGGLKSPIYGLHRALNWNLQKLVITLKTIEQSKLKVQS